MTTSVRPYVKDGIELDQIAVTGIRVNAHHGVFESEREAGQVFIADVVAHVATSSAAATDDLTATVNYSDLADRAAEILAGSPAQLIETVAEHIARALLEFEPVLCVDVTVHKPQAPLHVEFKDVTISIRRDLRSGSLWADKRIGSSAGMADDPLAPGSAGPVHDDFDRRPAAPVDAYLGIGGNLGEVEHTFRAALLDLHRLRGVEVRATSPLARTRPVGGPEQPDYLNAVIRISTDLSPRELLGALQGIEMVHGRERAIADGPRTLDLDILTFGDVTGSFDDLTVPHPRAHQRGFVLVPWARMQADAVIPGQGTVGDLAAAVGADGVEIVADPWPPRAEA